VIDFMEAVKGASKKVMVDPIRTCEPCHGHGTKSGKAPDTCKVCHGTGQQKISLQGFHMAAPCQACGGVGTLLQKGKECHTCGGVGRVRVHESVDVHVPAGKKKYNVDPTHL
jgi:molecular chaperone DnaJ